MRPVQPSLLGHLAVQHRPDEPLQPEVPDLLRQRERGRPLLDIKLKVIERVRERKGKNLQTPTICFVPTMVNSFNDDQAGEILNYAIKNRDVVKGVNFQPVSLTGRIPEEDRRKLRYTLSDLAYDLEEQTGYLTRDDWYPVPFVAPISWSTMYVGGMHFQDNYNYDIERVKRCVIHYATPDGKVIPFCAYNTGPNFREEIEKKFAVPIEEWLGRHA